MPKKLFGTVTSDKSDKTISVIVTRRETHPLYGKQYTVSKKYAVHDADNSAKIGDRVEIVEVRPISKSKTWSLDKIVESGHGQIEIREEEAV